MNETQKTITQWARQTFGEVDDKSIVTKGNEEMAELLTAVVKEQQDEIAAEIADVYIMLAQLAEYHHIDIQQAVNEKMQIVRQRKWNIDPVTGHGQHIKEAS